MQDTDEYDLIWYMSVLSLQLYPAEKKIQEEVVNIFTVWNQPVKC